VQPTIGEVAHRALAARPVGEVLASFSRAVYVRFPSTGRDSVVAIVPTEVSSGPIHIRVPQLPSAETGDPVVVHDGWMSVGGSTIDIPTMVWRPHVIGDLVARRRSAAQMLDDVLGIEGVLDLSGDSRDVRDELHTHGLRATVRRLAGRGAGLTPAGDDCAAGLLLVTALLEQGGMTTWPADVLSDLAATHASHAISVAFLEAAAQGASIEPVHLLLAACVTGAREEACEHREVLAGIGHTSGLDLAYGALLGLELADAVARSWIAERDLVISSSHRLR